jgi:hypothetical protein
MAKSIISKVMLVGRATVFAVGLAVVLALVLGVATAALGAPVSTFRLGQINTSNLVSTLAGAVAGPNLKIQNTGNDPNATALELQVSPGRAPMTVNAGAGKVTNLDADKVDGREAGSFANNIHEHAGEAITSGTVEADRIEDGQGSNLDADTVDGLDSTDLGAVDNVEVGQLELPVPTVGGPNNIGTVLETAHFEIQGRCMNRFPLLNVDVPEGRLFLVAKQDATNAIVHSPEESTTPRETNLQAGGSAEIAGTQVTSGSPDEFSAYGSYSADVPGHFIQGDGTVSINSNSPTGPGDACRFSATGLGQ